MRTTLLALLLFIQILSYSQISVEISGPTTATTNQTQNFYANWYDGWYLIFPPYGDYFWYANNGNVNSQGADYASVTWTTAGTGLLEYTMITWDNYYYDYHVVSVTGGAPAKPSTTFTITQNCGSTNVLRNSNPPLGVDWYWQTTANGQSTLLTNAQSINRTTAGPLYLRARLSSSPYTWSDLSQDVGNISIISTPPSAPSSAFHGNIISNSGGSVNLSVTAVSGATSYRWYTVPTGGTPIAGPTGTTFNTNVTQSTTYYVESVIGNCPSNSRRPVTATVHPEPIVTISNNGLIEGGNPVSLSISNYSYDSYQWLLNDGTPIQGETGTIFLTFLPGTFKLKVTKGGAEFITAGFNVTSELLNQNYNFIIINDVYKPQITSIEQAKNLPIGGVKQSIEYYDGLGRRLQKVITKGSPQNNDIIQPFSYDAIGRQAINYLPFVDGNDGAFKSEFKPFGDASYATLQNPQFAFYQGTERVAVDSHPYSRTIFEESPLNRVIEQGAAGSIWQPDATNTYNSNDRTIKSAYELNEANEVLLWTFTPPTEEYTIAATNAFGKVNAGTTTSPIYYAANTLYKIKTKDEHFNEVIEYKDKLNRTVLKKVQFGSGQYANTYFIYDDLGQLVCVIPPEAVNRLTTEYYQTGATDASKNTFLKVWAFRYRYDERGRMIMKQIPGAEPVYMVYDNRDRLVLTQDGIQRTDANGNITKREWTFTKYDALNRPVITGIYLHSSVINRTVMSGLISTTNFVETYNGVSSTHGYTNVVFPTTNLTVHTVTYYDNYNFKSMVSGLNYVTNNLSNTTSTGPYDQPSTENLQVKGLVTGTKVNILGSSSYLYSATYYDTRYRVIQTIAQNHKSGTDRISNLYDFAGRLLQTRRTYVVNGVTRYVQETFEYDHAGRLLTVKHSTNGATPIMTVKNEYNELGELVDKKLHSTDNGVTFKQSIDYRYNIRGWLTKINEPDVSALASGEVLEDYFGMELAYNNTLSGIASNSAFNGNISAVKWSTGALGGANLQGYHYNYDALNRLETSGHYKDKMIVGFTPDNANLETDFTYDLNGNIGSLKRRGADELLIDHLSYSYTGNRLDYVNDSEDPAKGFVNGNTGTDDYSYDANGNLIIDNNKGITAIEYNYLNLPKKVSKGTTNYIEYTYDATGRKLAQQVYGATPKRTDYVGELVFEGTTPALKIINHSEGRILPDGANWEYQYHLKDHLGNVRVTFTTKAQAVVSKTANFESAANTDFTNYFRSGGTSFFDIFDHTDAGTTYTYVQHLNGGVNGRVGVGKSMPVMPGDKVSIGAYAKYLNLSSTANLTPLINSLATAFGTSSGATGELGRLYNGLNSYASMVAGGDHPGDDETAPKAFVTILLFDKDYNLVDAAWKQITTVGLQTNPTVKQPPHDFLFKEVTVAEPGYAYVFISNEHPSYVDIYFDDVTVTHTPSPIVSSSDYYAFGMQHSTGERVGSLEQRYLYQGKESQVELELNTYDFHWRMYDKQLGRTWQMDPYSGMFTSLSPYSWVANNPINIVDPDGRKIEVTDDRIRLTGRHARGYFRALCPTCGDQDSNDDEQTAKNEATYWAQVNSSNPGYVSPEVRNIDREFAYLRQNGYSEAADFFRDSYQSGDLTVAEIAQLARLRTEVVRKIKAQYMIAIINPETVGTFLGIGIFGFANPTTQHKLFNYITRGIGNTGKGFKSFSAFKKVFGSAGQNQHWHHIVEQTPANIERFGAEAIHNTNNLVRINARIHVGQGSISAYYSQVRPFTNGQTVRQWLSGQSFTQQSQFGLRILERVTKGLPLP